MATTDKFNNKAQEVKGKVKEAVGNATNNDDLEAKGKTDQVKASVKDVGEKAKDVVDNVKHAIKK